MRAVPVALLALVAGCGRWGFDDLLPDDSRTDAVNPRDDAADARGDGAGGADAADAPTDATQPMDACVARWLAGDILVTPQILPNVNTSGPEYEPFLAADRNTLYFEGAREGKANDDVYTATVGAAFTDVRLVPDLNSPANEGLVRISEDGLVATIATDRAGLPFGSRNLWEATRASTADPFSGFTGDPFVNVNTDSAELEHWMSRDRLRIYVSTGFPSGQHITLATRASIAQPFSTPVPIAELDSPTTDSDCCHSLTGDERVIVFASGTAGGQSLYYSTRAQLTDPFSAPALIPIDPPPSNGFDLHTSVAADGCTLYFSSTRPGVGSFDLWRSDI